MDNVVATGIVTGLLIGVLIALNPSAVWRWMKRRPLLSVVILLVAVALVLVPNMARGGWVAMYISAVVGGATASVVKMLRRR